jgi:hypothetical protein
MRNDVSKFIPFPPPRIAAEQYIAAGHTPDLWFPNTKERNRHWCFFKRTRSLAESYGHA